MKLVVNPPSKTTTSFGSPVQKVPVPQAAEATPIGAAAVRPKLKQALRIPQKVATKIPFRKLNSAIAYFFCSSGISRSFVRPA